MTSGRNRKGGDELTPGQVVLDRYKVERLLDEGGMASIFLARDLQTGTKVAIKCLYRVYSKSDIVRARFVDEGRIQMMLQHPNIVRVYQFMEQPTLAFVMEFIEGKTLEDLLVDSGVLTQAEILEVIIPVLSAVGLAHSRHIVHRDLKPSNILINQGPRGLWYPKVMDFGVAKLKRTKQLTATGTTVGTLHYMSPEQIVGSKNIDGRADIYSLGITLYKLCTGDVPFNASTEFALMMAQVEARPTPPSQLNPRISPEFEQVILKALEKKPEARYQNIKEFTSALLDLHDERGQKTRDTIDVPASLIDFAMLADRVAVDRTNEMMAYTDDDDEVTSVVPQAERSRPDALLDMLGDHDESAQTTQLKPLSREDLEQDYESTIELESMRLDSLQTMDMSIDPTAQASISSEVLEQLTRESDRRKMEQYQPIGGVDDEDMEDTVTRSSGPLWDVPSTLIDHTESDSTRPIRMQTSEVPSPSGRAGGSQSSPQKTRSNPFERHTPSDHHSAPDSSPRLRSIPRADGSIPFNHSAGPTPPADFVQAPHSSRIVVGSAGVDTGDRTTPFRLNDAELELADIHEPYEATITADQYPPENKSGLVRQQQRGVQPQEAQSWYAGTTNKIWIGIVVMLSIVCVVLAVMIIL